ncbi:Na(+)/H(+) antiporter subunit D, partial [Solemya velum gill symbiont]
MSEFAFPPGLIMILGAFLIPFVSDARRSLLVMSLPILTLALVWLLPDGSNLQIGFLDYSLDPVRSSTEGRLFATIFSIMAFAGGLYALKQARTIELTAAFVYAGAAVGVTFAGDLIT